MMTQRRQACLGNQMFCQSRKRVPGNLHGGGLQRCEAATNTVSWSLLDVALTAA
jgi:hypothetical protein